MGTLQELTTKQATTFETNGYQYQGHWDHTYHFAIPHGIGWRERTFSATDLKNGNAVKLMNSKSL